MATVVGFTGTRDGMTDAQYRALAVVLGALFPISEAHHGDCVGADLQFHLLARSLCKTVSHPPTNPSMRAWTSPSVILEAKPYLDRDQDIVDASDVMIACPFQREAQRYSGTWATIRMARRVGKPLVIVYPDGDVTWERWPEPVPGETRRSWMDGREAMAALQRIAEKHQRENLPGDQFALGTLIDRLEAVTDKTAEVHFDFVYFNPTGFHSWRGWYNQIALGYAKTFPQAQTVAQLLEAATAAVGATFEGYKGGDFVMDRDTMLWVAEYDESGSTIIHDLTEERWGVILHTRWSDV